MPRRRTGGSLEDIAEEVRRELSEFEIGSEDLAAIFDPLVEECSKLARDEKEFRQCIEEAISTLKTIVRKVK